MQLPECSGSLIQNSCIALCDKPIYTITDGRISGERKMKIISLNFIGNHRTFFLTDPLVVLAKVDHIY